VVKVQRKTKEVEVSVAIELEEGEIEIDTGIGFFDHMLETFAFHSSIGLRINARGDLGVDEHHTVEDTAIALGKAIKRLIEDKEKRIKRFGHAIIPMDESVCICGLDLSGRGFFVLEGEFGDSGLKEELIHHFFDTLCRNAGINLYLQVRGKNSHHKVESAFKALALSLRQAIEPAKDVRSVKGKID